MNNDVLCFISSFYKLHSSYISDILASNSRLYAYLIRNYNNKYYNFICSINMFKGVLYFKLESLTSRVLGPIFRRTGQNLFRQGVAFQGELANDDRLVPSMRCIPMSDAKYPRLLDVS